MTSKEKLKSFISFLIIVIFFVGLIVTLFMIVYNRDLNVYRPYDKEVDKFYYQYYDYENKQIIEYWQDDIDEIYIKGNSMLTGITYKIVMKDGNVIYLNELPKKGNKNE